MTESTINKWANLIAPESIAPKETKADTMYKAPEDSVNAAFEPPIRKGRKREVSKNHPTVIECREMHIAGNSLHYIAYYLDLDYTILSRWYDKGWLEASANGKKRK